MPGSSPVVDWNSSKAYQCPRCGNDTVADPSKWEVYTCCNCGTRFARFPRLHRFLRHAGITCEWCTKRHPVPVDGKPFGFLRHRHNGRGMYAQDQVEAWLYDTDEYPNHRDRVRYVNTTSRRADAMADIAHWRSFLGLQEDDPRPVLAVVADEEFYKYGPDISDEQQAGFSDGTLEVYGVGVLRAYAPPHRRRGQFYAADETFTWGLIAPAGLEGIYTQQAPEPLAAHAPQL